jgi:hypothetical protein
MFFRSKPKKVEEKIEYVRTENPLLRPKKKDTSSVNPQVAEDVSDVSPTPSKSIQTEKDAVPKDIQPQIIQSSNNNVMQNASGNHVDTESHSQSTGEGPENNPAKPKRQ